MIKSLFEDVTRKTMLTKDEKIIIISMLVGAMGSFIAGCLVQWIYGGKRVPGA